jgi:hypothetical protein
MLSTPRRYRISADTPLHDVSDSDGMHGEGELTVKSIHLSYLSTLVVSAKKGDLVGVA